MSFRVCIPCAGTGSRLEKLTQFINKSLISIANRPAIAHIIDSFPSNTEFVIPLGHKGHLVREFLKLAYPKHQFYFSQVSPFEGSGSGLGLSLKTSEQHLQQPFVFISCDTLVEEPIPPPNHNWLAYADVPDRESYRTLLISANQATKICEKGEGKTHSHQAYIGLAGIYDYKHFWTAMNQGGRTAVQVGEVYGIRELLKNVVTAHKFTWHDTGNLEALEDTRSHYRKLDEPNILEKANEAIWFVGDDVIKFSDDQKFITNRVKRVKELRGYVPEVTGSGAHMYRYSRVEGEVLSKVATLPLFKQLLAYCDKFWIRETLSPSKLDGFRKSCMKFYREKTIERVELFYKNSNRLDGLESINGLQMETLDSMLTSLNWDWLADGLPGRFHGDFHFENILWAESNKQFYFLDWRQDFGGSLSTGDIYYDFAKLMHGLIVSHEIVSRSLYDVEWDNDRIDFDLHRKQILVECECYFGAWLKTNNYDYKKVKVLTALIYLNIAALHHHPYSLMLFALGKSMLKSVTDD